MTRRAAKLPCKVAEKGTQFVPRPQDLGQPQNPTALSGSLRWARVKASAHQYPDNIWMSVTPLDAISRLQPSHLLKPTIRLDLSQCFLYALSTARTSYLLQCELPLEEGRSLLPTLTNLYLNGSLHYARLGLDRRTRIHPHRAP